VSERTWILMVGSLKQITCVWCTTKDVQTSQIIAEPKIKQGLIQVQTTGVATRTIGAPCKLLITCTILMAKSPFWVTFRNYLPEWVSLLFIY